MSEERVMGPVSYLIVEFPDGKMTGEGFPILVDLVDRGLIGILDFRLLARGRDGEVKTIDLADVDHDGDFDFGIFDGVSSGLLDESDLTEAATVITPGSAAGILIFENRWAAPLSHALRSGGAELVAAGYVPVDALAKSLEASEPTNA
jgi:hypothetical protein